MSDPIENRIATLETEFINLKTRNRRTWATLLTFGTLLASAALATGAVPYTFSANTPAVANEINANFTDLDNKAAAAAARMPSGIIAYFNASTCPTGWSIFTPARGRVVLGLPPAATSGAVLGTAYTQDTQGPTHNHAWSKFDATGATKAWQTYDSAGSLIDLVRWGDGTDSAGAGEYPLEAYPAPTLATYYTNASPSYMPYVQLLPCSKD